MRAIRLRGDELTDAAVVGRILTHDLGHRLRKGTVLGGEHLEALRALPEIHVAELDPGDVHEDDAARRLGAAIAGSGTEVGDPVQSQIRVVATQRGLARVDREAVHRLNRLPAVGVFTVVDGQAVEAGEEVAGAKVTPVAVPGSLVEEAERLALPGPVVRVDPFRPLRTMVVVTERLKPRARQLFAAAVTRKLGWYGAALLAVREVERSGATVREAYEEARAKGAELVLFAGASSIDPLDAAYSELEAAGGRLLRQGIPAHPGSMLWLGRLDEATVLGVASCAGFGRDTALDLVLPLVFADGGASEEDFQGLGYGGLIEDGAGRRFPPYPTGE
jgi:molybdenum cofactor cytidylyltransferase